MTIAPPPRPKNHPDRFLDAQEAIETELLALVERAVAAGWGEREAIAAVVAVADNRMLALAADDDLDDLLKRFNL
jgi:hypothetical protein